MSVRRRSRDDERGVALSAYLMLAAVVVTMAGVFLVVLSYVAAGHQARGSADLAALGGAGALSEGRDGCAVAASVARANHSELVTCDVIGPAVAVEVSVPVGQLVHGLPDAVHARATAQPVAE